MLIEGKYLNGTQDLTEIYKIREKVFKEEQNTSEAFVKDAIDDVAIHAIISVHGKYLGTGRITFDGDEYKIGRIAILKEERGKKYGDFIVRMLIDRAFLNGGEEVVVDSQLHAIPFYEKIGFESTGERVVEDGIEHERMILKKGNVKRECQNH